MLAVGVQQIDRDRIVHHHEPKKRVFEMREEVWVPKENPCKHLVNTQTSHSKYGGKLQVKCGIIEWSNGLFKL